MRTKRDDQRLRPAHPAAHVVRGTFSVWKTLADGTRRQYHYAWRGGPRVNDPSSHDEAAKASRGGRVRRAQAAKPTHCVLTRPMASKLCRNARTRATARGLPFDLTTEAVWRMLETSEGKCALSGIQFDLSFNAFSSHARNPLAPSLDRIDNAGGYTVSNSRIVLSAVNYGINEWGADLYFKICAAISFSHKPREK